MRKYELTVLVKDETLATALEKKMEQLVKALGGKVSKTTEMGKKQLAYKIQKLSEAFFVGFVIELPPESVVQLEKKLSVDHEVLRHLMLCQQDR